jgi:thiol-disulfide isomerase/thioredoxin
MNHKYLLLLPLFLLFHLIGHTQTAFERITDPQTGSTLLKGILSRELLEQEKTFPWMHKQQKGYRPDSQCVRYLNEYKDSIHFLVFMGTWCEDSQVLIPQFFQLVDSAGFNNSNITILGVDRNKETLGRLSAGFLIDRIPTFIILKGGKEIGRVVEYGKSGRYDHDLSLILKAYFTLHN